MGRRLLPALLALVAVVADGHGSHGLAFYALLGAVPFASVSALAAFGDYLEAREDAVAALQSFLWGLAVVLLVLSCSVRSPGHGAAPPIAVSAVVACLGIFAVKACLVAAPYARRLALRPAKP